MVDGQGNRDMVGKVTTRLKSTIAPFVAEG